MPLTEAQQKAVLEELADLKSGVSSHVHTSSRGVVWRCTSPYCDRGGDVRDEPQAAPGESQEAAQRYRRVYA